MGERSGDCQRLGSCPEAEYRAKVESELHNEINTTLEIQRFGKQWLTKDYMVTFQKRQEGWVAFSFSDPICKVFREYGLIYQPAGTSSYELTYFPSLKAAQQAVNDVSLEAGLNIDSRLTRQKFISYKIGDLPLIIKRHKGHWRVYVHSSLMSPNLKKYFNNIKAFLDSWESTDSAFAPHPTRKVAHQAVTNWLAQTMAVGK